MNSQHLETRNLFSVGVPLASLAFIFALYSPALAEDAPVVSSGFKLTTFATPPAGLSKPDSISIINGEVWIGYGNEGKKDGADNAMSAIVTYSMDGKVLKTLALKGHNDGVKLDPATGKVWAMNNEDGNPSLDVIDPKTWAVEHYTFGKARHGGGYDDIVFASGGAYVTASNPSVDGGKQNPGSSIEKAVLGKNHKVMVSAVLSGTPTVTDITTGKSEKLNLADPDSITVAPTGDLVMTSQDDAELLFVSNFSTKAKARVLHLKGGVKVDDTTFVNGAKGFLLVSDTPANVVYKIESDKPWEIGQAYSAMSGVDADEKAKTPAIAGYVGNLDLKSGALTPIVDKMQAPHGLAFVTEK
ncbi:MAG: hypothetical protein M3O03_00605 [Pseudomonadota bacterium]|nr:hypothetical protein [Pseudomonadota bacterium]